MGIRNLKVLALYSPLFAKRKKILRHLSPALGLAPADGDDQGGIGKRWVKEWAVFPRGLWIQTDLLIDVDVNNGIEVIDARDGGCPLDQVARKVFLLPVMGEGHGHEMPASGQTGDVKPRRVTSISRDISVDPGNGRSHLSDNL
jgi:hypothetical protein